MVAGEAKKEGIKILEPHLKGDKVKTIGKVVIVTVKGDMHDIGKNVVAIMLSAAGFNVTDLGADVPVERFVEAVKEGVREAIRAWLIENMDYSDDPFVKLRPVDFKFDVECTDHDKVLY